MAERKQDSAQPQRKKAKTGQAKSGKTPAALGKDGVNSVTKNAKAGAKGATDQAAKGGKDVAKMSAKEKEQMEKLDQDRRNESRKAAKKALELQKMAQELTKAAAGAADPDERQKLLNEALNKSIEAESFGKTARYMQSGTFQGMLFGGGIGTGFGVGLGVITGTLVGGVTSVITGSLGAGLGIGIGALHGPWFKPGELIGNTIRKITGDLPGWKATDEQKKALEKMIGQVNEQSRPTDEELEAMTVGDESLERSAMGIDEKGGQTGHSWVGRVYSWIPGSGGGGGGDDKADAKNKQPSKKPEGKDFFGGDDQPSKPNGNQKNGNGGKRKADDELLRAPPDETPAEATNGEQPNGEQPNGEGDADKKTRSGSQAGGAKKPPRKLQSRQQAKRAPKTESEAPKSEGEAPKSEGEAPRTESEAPKTESEAPKTESEAPKTESKAPGGEGEAAPKRKPKKLEMRTR